MGCGQRGVQSNLAKVVCGLSTILNWNRHRPLTLNGTAPMNGCPSMPLHRPVQAFPSTNSWWWFTLGRAATTIGEGLPVVFTCINGHFMKAFSARVLPIAGMKFSRFVSPFDEVNNPFFAPDELRFLGQSSLVEHVRVNVGWHR